MFRDRWFGIGWLVIALVVCTAAVSLPATALAADEHAAGADGHEAGGPDPLQFKTDLAIWTFAVFVLLFLILRKLAWGPISEALDKREQRIADNIEAARQTHEEARRLLAQYEQKLAGAADQVREMLDEARRDAEHTKQEIVAEAKSAAGAEQQRAMREIRTATDAAVKELSERSTDLAIELAGKVISAKLTGEERSRLVQESLNQFAATPSAN